MATKSAFPQFAQTGPRGEPQQQDAEEFLSGLLSIASQESGGTVTVRNGFMGGSGKVVAEKDLVGVNNLIDALFGIKMEETFTCDEIPVPSQSEGKGDAMEIDTPNEIAVEPEVVKYDLHRKLVCNIQGGSDTSSQVNISHIIDGINLSLSGKITKRSEILGRDCLWTRKQRIDRLPSVLVVQFGRFFWKETPDSQDHTGVKCKVMKPVAFSGTLDVYEFCSDRIQKVLKIAKDKALAAEEDRIAKKLKCNPSTKSDFSDSKSSGEDEDLKVALAMSIETDVDGTGNFSIGLGLPENFQGVYELFAVVTHKGRDADGGHYMGWVKSEFQGERTKIGDTDEDNDDWFVFDDDEVSPCKTEDVLKLKGGGDWHMSYLNFYRAKK
mmetsp:Transcript_52/g.80  ORF Transcript_52/g.80 Transcript_52/m.80 type:complete len:382 (-) Transcript_52:381-1526(-)